MTRLPERPTALPVQPFVRESGSGPSVVCLHANASSSAQWRALTDLLAPRFRVLAPDAYDAGKSPLWGSDRVIQLRDEVALLDPVFQRAGATFTLVGHSYGAAVALIAALAHPARVRALVLYEPTLFSLIDAQIPAPNSADGIRGVVAAASRALDSGHLDHAAAIFIDYWMGDRVWEQMPVQRKAPITASIVNVRRWGHALLSEPTPLAAFRSLTMPVLYLMGKQTTASARGVATLLTSTLPNVEVMEFDHLGHMGPVTNPDIVNQTVERFLGEHT